MNILSSYFARIQTLLKYKGLEKNVIANVVNEVLTIVIEEKQLKIAQDGVVYVTGSSSLKNAIYFKKKEIIDKCLEKGVKISDLR